MKGREAGVRGIRGNGRGRGSWRERGERGRAKEGRIKGEEVVKGEVERQR